MLRRLRNLLVPDLIITTPTNTDEKFDPFQVFEVTPEPCQVLRVTVLGGRNISKGWAGDLLDTPDPYVILKPRFTPNSSKKTRCIDNDPNPVWNETFEFFIDAREINTLDITVMDANYTIDEKLASLEFDLSQLQIDRDTEVELRFNVKSTLTLKFNLTVDKNPDLRYSLALCDQEKEFLKKRKHHILRAMQGLLGTTKGPKNLNEVPVVGILGSGGGFRAMVCLSGAIKALSDQKILDCTTFMAGLSGSAWYMSTLYSHPDFPRKGLAELQEELKLSIDQSPFWLLNPRSVYRYTSSIYRKKRSGQPVSFTDFFGHMLGDTLLVDRYDCKLTEQRSILLDGKIPLPLYTCLHVKKNVMAKVFQEWIEFSPYEVGIAKYGTFMKSEHFGSKFFMGRIVKLYSEFPLHYLQGVWGSAFCILFRQLAREKGKKDLAQVLQDSARNHREEDLQEQLENFTIDDKDSELSETDDESDEKHRRRGSTESNLSIPHPDGDEPKPTVGGEAPTGTSIWGCMMTALMNSNYFNTLSGRAASIFNPLRGLSLQYLYPISPFSPTTPNDELDFKGRHEALSTENKTLYLVDSGLTFNSPYPLLLRPQRSVELFLSFDFSARSTDQTPPFKEILMAEKWAKMNNIPFPPIEKTVRDKYANEPVRECYVFEHPTDLYCPIILHFVIVNNEFKQFKAPGVPRTTKEDVEFADFSIFDDPRQPYSLYNFSFTHELFDRIASLMEFNTLFSVELIKETMASIVARKRQVTPRPPISLADVARLKLRFRNKEAAKQLHTYVRSFSIKATGYHKRAEETQPQTA